MEIQRMIVGPRLSEIVIHGDTIYLCGQVAEQVPVASVAGQTREVLAHIDRLLALAGSDKCKLLSATVYLADMSGYPAMNEIWDAWVTPGHAPARACVGANLARPEYLVEISAIAAR